MDDGEDFREAFDSITYLSENVLTQIFSSQYQMEPSKKVLKANIVLTVITSLDFHKFSLC